MTSANQTAILPEAPRKSNAGPGAGAWQFCGDTPRIPEARYVCARCANCCRWPGYVRLRDDETGMIARFLERKEDDFLRHTTRLTADRRGLSLIEKPDGSCIFLEGNNCLIQPVKPRQCRDFPQAWNFPGFEQHCRAQRVHPASEAHPPLFQRIRNTVTSLFQGKTRAVLLLLMVCLMTPRPALTEMPVVGARSEAKARWLRQWLGVEGKTSVTYDDIRIPSKALQDRDIVKSAIPVPLHLLPEPAMEEEDGEDPYDHYLQDITLTLSREGRKDIEGLWQDFWMFMVAMPECCVDILKGRLEITSPNGHPRPEGIPGDQPVGLLVKEHSRVEIRDRIHWAFPPEPGINVRSYDMVRPGDRWQGQFTDRKTSRDYKFRAVIPSLSLSAPTLGLEADGRWRNSTADFVWDGEAEDSAGELLREGGCGTRWYHGLNGSYVAMGFRQSTINFDDLNNDGMDWSAFSGNYRQLYVTVNWHFNPLDYDPDVLFAPGSGAAVTFISGLESLGSPVSFEEVQGTFEQTRGLFHRLFLDIRISGAVVEGLPRVLLPELGGSDTVRGHSPQMSADRLVSVQQSLRHHFYWRQGVVFIPYVFGDVGWASQIGLEETRRDDWLYGTGVGARWEFGEMYGFKMLEFTLARGLGDNGDFQVDVRTRFDF